MNIPKSHDLINHAKKIRCILSAYPRLVWTIANNLQYDLNLLKHVLQNVTKILSMNEINVRYKCLSNNV